MNGPHLRRERERERNGDGEREREREIKNTYIYIYIYIHIYTYTYRNLYEYMPLSISCIGSEPVGAFQYSGLSLGGGGSIGLGTHRNS